MKLDSDKAAEIVASHAQQFNTKRPTVRLSRKNVHTHRVLGSWIRSISRLYGR